MSRGRREAGFTLLEVLVVVAIIGITGAIVLGRGPARSARLDVRGAAGVVSGALRLTRSQAIATGGPVRFSLDPVTHAWRVGNASPRTLPGTLAVAAPPGGIVFTPQGASSGGRIDLASGTIHTVIDVDWLTGRVSVRDGG